MKTAEEILKKYDYDVIKRPRPKLMLAMQEYATQERQKAIQECQQLLANKLMLKAVAVIEDLKN